MLPQWLETANVSFEIEFFFPGGFVEALSLLLELERRSFLRGCLFF